ncbi:DNA-binding response regulator, OmpR family, contains REC and winged-helix (wHTH) domain [Propionispira arboris]|uniref:DNA-binding response regulator, OmpR family, contains REC and winged-helix (WHTH) domain n=1 Tax=Propionispira arboris TaxID=84035 RepID=A0A1H6X983_9FIRM|nr:response regulator transcription factor [Propionispira arboris]SEJ21460.1 DNA-binding response regulator, OmpR family, contains REC and winged-helix (wHTH) domain [Propionispira arboris]
MLQHSVLIVDDDVKLVELLQTYFEQEQFLVYTAYDGLEAIELVNKRKPDIMILDIMLPGMDGREVCRKIRQHNDVPIIMLTAKDDESDRLVGLGIGADDYVTKPFSMKEVVARAKVILRRIHGEVVEKKTVLQFREIMIDLDRHQVKRSGEVVDLTPTEFKLLEVLARAPERVYSRFQLMENTQGYAFDGYERTIDAHIRNLRRKLEPDSRNPQYVLTVYGVGYKFAGESHV